jgi:glucose/arabinose dehydrogenase
MARRTLSLATAVLTLLWTLLPAAPVLAHCPNPPTPPDYLETFFAPINASGTKIKLELVTSGLVAPNKGTVAPGLPNHLFVVDQPGQVWAVNLTTGARTLFLDVSARLVTLGVLGPNTFDERGLLGLAFHPNFQQNGLLYTYTSEPNAGPPTFPTTLPVGSTADHQNVVAEWAVNPANPLQGVIPGSRQELLRVDWPQFNHDGGDLAFGPDGFLYISMGDGGGADDADGQQFIVADGAQPANTTAIVGHQGDGNAQKLNTPLGKILRIDVNGSNSGNGQYGIPSDNPFIATPGAVDEIFAFGFRNPFRMSFDTATGDLYVGDVGQNDIEEVDLVVKGGNYGWNPKEGTLFFHINGNEEGFASEDDNGRTSPGMIDPIAQYDTHGEGHSVIGGFVYHGSRIPQLKGHYVFGEFSRVFNFPGGPHNSGRLFSLAQKQPKDKLLNIKEFNGLGDAIAALGLAQGPEVCEGDFPRTLAVLGFGQDAQGEIYVTGNFNGLPFGTGGVVLRLAPTSKK